MKTIIQQPTIILPRMAQLETLEAKMANIEVSLSNTPRKKKNGSISGFSIGSSVRSKKKTVKESDSVRNSIRSKESPIVNKTIPYRRDSFDKEKKKAEEALNKIKENIDNKSLTIKNLKMAIEKLDITDNIDVRIQQAELEYQLGREELNLLTLLEETRDLQMCLEEFNKSSSETLYSCFNGEDDVLLHRTEIEYDPSNSKFTISTQENCKGLWVKWVSKDCDLCCGDRVLEINGKLVLLKNEEDLEKILSTGPNLLKIVVLRKLLNKSNLNHNHASFDMVETLQSELDVVRSRAEEIERTKDLLRSDNIKLTHRISYLEEQVSELSAKIPKPESKTRTPVPSISTVKTKQNVTSINITTEPVTVSKSNDLQIFQKGPQVTTLVSISPSEKEKAMDQQQISMRSRSSLSNITSVCSESPSYHHQYRENNSRNSKHHPHHYCRSTSSNNLSSNHIDGISYNQNHKHYPPEHIYQQQQSTRYRKHMDGIPKYVLDKRSSSKEYLADKMNANFNKATKIIQDLTRKNKDSKLFEKHKKKHDHAHEHCYDEGKSVLTLISEMNNYKKSKSAENLDEHLCYSDVNEKINRRNIQSSRSVKSLDFDSDCVSSVTTTTTNGHVRNSSRELDYTSEPTGNNRFSYNHQCNGNNMHHKGIPMPPKKPLRMSLSKSQSLQLVSEASMNHNHHSKKESRKCLKRNYKGEIPFHLMPVNVSFFSENGAAYMSNR